MISIRRVPALLLTLALAAAPAAAGPTVVPTTEGQIGDTPGLGDKVLGPARFESIRGQAGELVFGGIFVAGGPLPPPPEVQFFTDRIHATPNPAMVGMTASAFTKVDKVTPASAWSRNATDDGDFVAFSFAVDGAMPDTLTVRIATFDENGTSMVQVPIVSDVDTFPPPFPGFLDPTFAKTGVAVDDQGRATVVYTEFSGGVPQVKATRVDAANGTILDPGFLVNDLNASPGAALLDPAGDRLVIVSTDLGVNPAEIRGNVVDFSGASPVVLPEFPISSTPAAFGNVNPAVAADPATGAFTVAWEHVTGVSGDPVDVRARRFDAMGNPVGDDFRVNTSTANDQGQPSVAYGPAGLSAIVWASPPAMPQSADDLDVFLQVYDPSGQPIGGEIKVNTFTDDTQDRPAVRFLPDRDAQGRPQVAVVWRDAADTTGAGPRGTGASYRCFAVNGFEEQVPIFEDGFESGDTTSWSSSQP